MILITGVADILSLVSERRMDSQLNHTRVCHLKSNRRMLVFLNMSLQGPALVSSVAVHKGSSIYLFKGHQPLFLFILPICGPGQISVLWILIGGDWIVIGGGDRYGHGG